MATNNHFKVNKGLTIGSVTADPTTPEDGMVIYRSDLGKFRKYENGAWSDLGSGSGSGGINYVENADFETDLTGWNSYADGAATPVDGTGGSSTITVTRDTAAPLRGTASLKLVNGALGDGIAYDISAHYQDLNGKRLYVSFDYQLTATAAEEYKVYIYDISNATMIDLGDDGFLVSSTYPTRFTASFETANQETFRLILHKVTANATTLYIDNVKIGPDVLVPGTINRSAVVDATGSGSFTGGSFRVTQAGQQIVISGLTAMTHASAPSAASAAGLLPTWAVPDTGISNVFTAVTGQLLRITIGTDGSVSTAYYDGSGAALNRTDSSSGFTISYTISGSGGAMLSTTEANLSTVKARMYKTGSVQAVTTGSNVKVNFTDVSFDTHNVIDLSNDVITIPRDGYYLINAMGTTVYSAGAASGYRMINRIVIDGSTIIAQASYRNNGLSDGANNSPGVTGLVYLNKGQTVQLNVFQDTGATYNINVGTESTFLELIELPDFSTFSVWGETDHKEAKSTLINYTIAASTWGDLTSIELQPGEWDITAQVLFYNNGAVTAGNVLSGIGTASGTGTTGLSDGDTLLSHYNVGTTGYRYPITISNYRVSHSTTTTYYLKANKGGATTNLQVAYRISARRIK